MEGLSMNENKIYHVRFNNSGKDYYFGSIAAIYETFDRETMGISQNRLYVAHIDENHPFDNGKVLITKGRLERKKTNRNKRR
ncbi:MAG: hypothetical protein IKI25_04795 [Bacteroidales bacterium]|nr:hypothetical protein [Bacteroidales bacterium]